jgi:hypothetical protein
LVKQYLYKGKPRNVIKPLGRPKKVSAANRENVLISPEAHKEPLGDVVLRLTNGYFTND